MCHSCVVATVCHDLVYFLDDQPVNMFPANSLGFYDVYGNVWEWLEDQYNGLPGFKTHYLYSDFSAPCFDGRHTMMTVSHLYVCSMRERGVCGFFSLPLSETA